VERALERIYYSGARRQEGKRARRQEGKKARRQEGKKLKEYSTWDSDMVPHRGNNQARTCLTSLSRRKVMLSCWYGGIHHYKTLIPSVTFLYLEGIFCSTSSSFLFCSLLTSLKLAKMPTSKSSCMDSTFR
jgi:hypothetical protein